MEANKTAHEVKMITQGVPVGFALSIALWKIQIEAISPFQFYARGSNGNYAERDD